MAAIELSPAVFAILSSLIEEQSGLHYDVVDRQVLCDKIAPLAIEKGFDSLLDYYYFLRYDPAGVEERQRLIESLVVHETYFFRELEQLKALVGGHVRALIDSGQRPRIWCAACATGEEPLTLAILLADQNLLREVDILATDISAYALERAQRGQYNGRSTRMLPSDLAARWFERRGEQTLPLEGLRETIAWQRLNLVDTAEVAALGQFDAILCRNVLIYFRDQTAQRVVTALSDALKPGGQLLVGASESLLRFGTSLRCEERGGAFFYEKVA